MSSRTLQVQAPHMKGADVLSWQAALNRQMDTWGVDYRLTVDGDYGITTRDLTATVLYGLGIPQERMAQGVTRELRVKVRGKKLSVSERVRYRARARWRARLRKRHASGGHVAPPLAKILGHSWGWHPGVHDGVDLICNPDATIYALCDARVVDVRSSGWWGLGAQPAAGHPVSDGDGIIQLECLTDVGPFKRGLHFAYGHAEHATVMAGQIVKAGTPIGRAGFANAWHVHFMVNAGRDDRGVGDRDPMPFVEYALKH